MGDGYWNHQQASLHQSAGSMKRPRTEFDLPPSGLAAASEVHNYHVDQNDDWGGPRPLKDTKSLGSAYDHYLQNSKLPSEEGSHYGQVGLERALGVNVPPFQMRNHAAAELPEAFAPELYTNGRGPSFGGPLPIDRVARPRETLPLPPDASNTLYIEGLPADCTKREVAHIFRPFVGYKEVRIVRKEPKYRGGDHLIMSFVDFIDPACAATALSALQGYKMDEHDPHSPYLKLQFSKFPGARSGAAPRGRR
ncbi:hypothetical protein RD792_000858 [Penstemon davidsonii]|uniref:RRM domain-containing protein n=1 Tax=Penstemon davidsonii TaxID=160366 RepID=A0ABR0DLV6_9LAMI|nr:hypothetical protein RD792_000858 [Penstemon davidsonii]